MIPNELNVGDWYFKDKPVQIESIEDIEWLNHIFYLMDLDEESFNEEFKPIKLTPKILKDNGFKKNGHYYELELPSQSVIIRSDCYILKIESTGLSIAGTPNVTIVCEDVHKMQHAFELCGIIKDIEL